MTRYFRRKASAVILLLILALFPLAAKSLDPVQIGAGIITNHSTPVFQSPQIGNLMNGVEVNPAFLSIDTEVAVITGGDEWVEIAYYSMDTYERRTGWIHAINVMNLRNHLTPGSHYKNIHDNADILDAPKSTGALLGRLPGDEQVDVVASTSEWVQIVYPKTGRRGLGWVRRSYVVPEFKGVPLTSDPSLIPSPENTKNANTDIDPDAPIITPNPAVSIPAVTPPPQVNLDFLTTKGAAHTVTLNAPDTGAPTPLRRGADAYASIAANYYNGVIGEYISYDVSGWVQVRIGTAVGFFPVDSVWVDAPPGIIPSAIPSAQVGELKQGSHLNVREYPNINSVVLDQLSSGVEIEVLAENCGSDRSWLHIRTPDLVGYVAVQYTTNMVHRYVDPRTIPSNPAFSGELGASLVIDETYSDTQPEGQDADITIDQPIVDNIPVIPMQTYTPSYTVPILPRYAIVNNPSGGMLNLRQSPSMDSMSLGLYHNGVRVSIDASYDEKWVRVSIGLTSGYMSLDYLQITNVPESNSYTYPPSVPRSTLTRSGSSGLTVYAAPSDLSDRLGSYDSGTNVTVLGEYNIWYHVYIQGHVGYIRKENVRPY